MSSTQNHSDAADTDIPEEPQSDYHFRGLLRWSNMTPCFGQFCSESSFIGRITRLVSPLKNQTCLGNNYNDSHSSRQKPTNKCPIILTPWRAKKLWKLMLAKSRFVHSFASAQEKGFSSECSPAVLDMFPLRSLVSRWEYFMKNLFTVTRFKYVYPIMWGQDEALQKPAHVSKSKEINKKDQSKVKPKARDPVQPKKIDLENLKSDKTKSQLKAHVRGRRARERSESGSSDRSSSFSSTFSDYSSKKWSSPKRVNKRAADRPSHAYRRRPRRVKEVRRRRSKPRSRPRKKAKKRVSRRKKPAQRKRPKASKKKASQGRKRKTKSKRR